MTQLAGSPLHTSPEGQPPLTPSVLVHAVVLVPGWQVWQGLLAFEAPDVTIVPPMSHCEPHAPLAQTCPLPQLVPSATSVHPVVLDDGWQTSQPPFVVAPDA